MYAHTRHPIIYSLNRKITFVFKRHHTYLGDGGQGRGRDINTLLVYSLRTWARRSRPWAAKALLTDMCLLAVNSPRFTVSSDSLPSGIQSTMCLPILLVSNRPVEDSKKPICVRSYLIIILVRMR
jgi:hypothetical protein